MKGLQRGMDASPWRLGRRHREQRRKAASRGVEPGTAFILLPGFLSLQFRGYGLVQSFPCLESENKGVTHIPVSAPPQVSISLVPQAPTLDLLCCSLLN